MATFAVSLCLLSKGGLKVDWGVGSYIICWWLNTSIFTKRKDKSISENRTLGCLFPSLSHFKKSEPLMRHSRGLLFYILHFTSTTFVRSWLLMPCPVLIHTSRLINYSIYPLIRHSDRVNNCFLGVLWVAACYQARNNAQELRLKQCDFPRLVDFRSNKHLVGISYGGFLIHLVDGIFSLNTSLAELNISEVWTGVPLFKKNRSIKWYYSYHIHMTAFT